MIIPVHIISLASATHRCEDQTAQVQLLGFEPRRSNAVGIHDIRDAFFHEHAFAWQRALKKTVVAYLMSHLQLCQSIAKSDGSVVVLADDMVKGSDWLADVQLLATQPQSDFVCLEKLGEKTQGNSEIFGYLGLRRLAVNSAGVAAYFLLPSGSPLMLARNERCGVALVDAFIKQIQGWRIWKFVHASAVQRSMDHDLGFPIIDHSEFMIAREQHSSVLAPSLTVRWIIKGCRLLGELNKAWRQVVSLVFYKRTRVSFLITTTDK
jgi:GR25 family glycosyltransferase involved in LPS biosynthesis